MEYNKIVRALLGDRKLSLTDKVNSIKHRVNPPDYKNALKMHPALSNAVYHHAFFPTIGDIRQKEAYGFSQNLKIEYRWLLNLIENYYEEINFFLSLKLKFETLFIKGEFADAQGIAKEIEVKFGVSEGKTRASLYKKTDCLQEEGIGHFDSEYDVHNKAYLPLLKLIILFGIEKNGQCVKGALLDSSS